MCDGLGGHCPEPAMWQECSRALRMLRKLFSSGTVGCVLFLEGMPPLEPTEAIFLTSDHI